MSEFNTTIPIPIGFHFEPTDEELIRGFLLPRMMGVPLPWNGIVYRELYGASAAPWVVFGGSADLVLCKITRCIKNSRGHRATPPQPQFFSTTVVNGGGSGDVWVPAAAAVSKKRAAEECWDKEVETYFKKHKSSDRGGDGGFSEAAAEGVGVEDDSWLLSAMEFDDGIDIGSLIDFDSNIDDLGMVS